MSIPLLVTVVETPEFIARTDKLMVDEDRHALIDYLARTRQPAISCRAPAAFESCGGA